MNLYISPGDDNIKNIEDDVRPDRAVAMRISENLYNLISEKRMSEAKGWICGTYAGRRISGSANRMRVLFSDKQLELLDEIIPPHIGNAKTKDEVATIAAKYGYSFEMAFALLKEAVRIAPRVAFHKRISLETTDEQS